MPNQEFDIASKKLSAVHATGENSDLAHIYQDWLEKSRFSGSIRVGFRKFQGFVHSTLCQTKNSTWLQTTIGRPCNWQNFGFGSYLSGLGPIFGFGSGFEDLRFFSLYFVPNQEFDIASKKLLAALATGDLLLFLSFIDVTEVFEFKFEAVRVLAELLSRPRWEWLLVTGNKENLEQLGAKIITLCSF